MTIFGAQPYGVGTATVAQDLGGSTLKDAAGTGIQQGSRKIDPKTKDYVIDPATGRIQGMSNAQQLVYLAVNTTLGASALRSLGQEIMLIDRITSNFERRVDTTLRRAVQHIVDRGLIEVVDTQVTILRPGVAVALLLWRDLSSGDDDSTPVAIPFSG